MPRAKGATTPSGSRNSSRLLRLRQAPYFRQMCKILRCADRKQAPQGAMRGIVRILDEIPVDSQTSDADLNFLMTGFKALI